MNKVSLCWGKKEAIAEKENCGKLLISLKTTKPRLTSRLYRLNMVPVGGLEPPRPKATDFESVVYTNFTTPASLGNCPLMFGIIRKLFGCASTKD